MSYIKNSLPLELPAEPHFFAKLIGRSGAVCWEETMAAKVFAWLIFGLIGMAAFGYGKKQGKGKAMILGGALMAYPYAVDGALALWAVGAALTAGLFVWRD